MPCRSACLSLMVGAWVVLVGMAAPQEVDPLVESRALYNRGEWARAIEAAAPALQQPGRRSEVLLLIGRATLEQFRETADPLQLARAREALREVQPTELSARGRTELSVGLGAALYLDASYRASAELFESVLGDASDLPAAERDRVLDWWATALDRFAQTRPGQERSFIYQTIGERMASELRRTPGSAAAAYWRPYAALARGEVDLAWHLAVAGWVHALLVPPNHAGSLRQDLDRLVVEGVIERRLERLANISDVDAARRGMLAEWESVKRKWTR